MGIQHIISRDAEFFGLGIVPILLADILACHPDTHTSQGEELNSGHADNGRRHQHVNGPGIHCGFADEIPVGGIVVGILVIHIILYLIGTQSQITDEIHPVRRLPGG